METKFDLKLTIVNLFNYLIGRKRKSVTNASEVVTKNRKVEAEEADVENNQRKNSKITILREAIDDAHIELRQSIRDTMDSLSSDIEDKGRKVTIYFPEIDNFLSVEVLKTVIKDTVMSAEMQEAVDTIQFVLGIDFIVTHKF